MQLFCGTGKACITPEKRMLPGMMSLGGMKFADIHDDLYVRTLLLDNGYVRILLVSFDLDKAPYPEAYMELLSNRLKMPKDHILFIGIHTHTAPVTGYRPFEPKHDISKKPDAVRQAVKEYEKKIESQLLAAAEEAVRTIGPVRMGIGYGSSYINVNRCQKYEYENAKGNISREMAMGYNGVGAIDHTVSVLKFENMNGTPVAFFINYAVHSTVMFLNDCGDGTSVISGDIGGNTSQCLENRYPGTVAMWSSGAAGDIAPIFSTQMFYPDWKNGRFVEERIKSLTDSELMLRTLVGRHVADICETIEKIECVEDKLEMAAAEEYIGKIRMHLLLLGGVAIIGVNGELYSGLGQKIRDAAQMEHVIIVNHDASLMLENPGYIYDDITIQDCAACERCLLPGNITWDQNEKIGTALQQCTKTIFSRGLLRCE